MRQALPEKLGAGFWITLVVGVFWYLAVYVAFVRGLGYAASILAFAGFVYPYRIVKRVRDVRLGRRLEQDPELSRIYYARD